MITIGTVEKIQKLMASKSDGSLPEITISFNNETDKKNALNYILLNAKLGDDVTVWDENKQMDTPMELLTKKQLISALKDSHVYIVELGSIVDIGLGVFFEKCSIDFQTGKSWTNQSVGELLHLLSYIKMKFNATKIILDEEGLFFSDKDREFFNRPFIKSEI